MKKIFAFLLTATLLCGMLFVPVQAATRAPFTAPQADIVVNGVRDAAYGPDTLAVNLTLAGGVAFPLGGQTDAASGTLSLAWNAEHIFVHMEVRDTTPNPGGTGTPVSRFHMADSVEFWIGWLTPGHFSRITVQAAPMPGFDELNLTIRNNEGAGNVNYNTAATMAEAANFVSDVFRGPLNGSYANGYVIEFAIKASAIASVPAFALGQEFMFEVTINDNRTGADREAQVVIANHPSGNTVLQEPNADNMFQPLVLGAAVQVATGGGQTGGGAEVVTGGGQTQTGGGQTGGGGGVANQVTGDVVTVTFAIALLALIAAAFVVRKRLTA
jgi:hypothetical protein